jgi:hypothetical protein
MLYEVIIANYQDDSCRSKLVLSYSELGKSKSLETFLSIDGNFEYIQSINKPNIFVHAWDEVEYEELGKIRNQISTF